MSQQVVLPIGSPSQTHSPLARRSTGAEIGIIGMVDNTKPKAEEVLRFLLDELDGPQLQDVVYERKGGITVALTERQLERLGACDLVLVATAD